MEKKLVNVFKSHYCFRSVVCLFLLCILCLSPVLCFADSVQDPDASQGLPDPDPSVVYVPADDYSQVLDDIKSGVDDLNDPARNGVIVGDLVDSQETRLRVSSSDATGLKSVLLSIIGEYETVVTDYTYQTGSSGYYSHSINIERDWAWICSCAIFGAVIWCVFRGVVAILCRN